jgi:hypothetical protein
MTKRFLTLLLVVLLGTIARAQEPTRLELKADEIKLGTTWYGVYIQGAKSGHAKLELVRDGDAFVFRTNAQLSMQAMGQAVRMDITDEQRFAAAAPFAYRGGRTEIKGGPQTMTFSATPAEGKLAVTIQDPGGERALDVDMPDYTIADALASEIWPRRAPKAGDTLAVRAFDLSNAQASIQTLTVLRIENRTVLGVASSCYVVSITDSVNGAVGTSRITPEGDMLSTFIGNFAELRREPEDVAKQLEKGGDLFFESFTRIDKPLGDPRLVRAMVLEAEGKGVTAFEAGPGISVDRTGDKVRLTIGPGVPAVTATEAEIADCLVETVEYPVADERVVALAKEAVGDAATPREKVVRLVGFVYGYIEKAMRPEPVWVLEVLTSKRGDCQEHAILFTTLARAAGVPARTVGGIAYVGDEIQAFGGHAWNEVLIDGKWVPVDPTWNEAAVDATHVRLGPERRGLTQMTWALGGMSFKLVSVETTPAPEPDTKKER